MATFADSSAPSGLGSFVGQGILFERNATGIYFGKKYVGEDNVPQDVKRRRRQVYDMMRHMGAPVLIKQKLIIEDVERGVAVRSDNYDPVYGQTRAEDPLSHGGGFMSDERSENEWISPDGDLVKSETRPSEAHQPAPKYRGFGPGTLIYLILPDVQQDIFKLDPTGTLTRVQSSTAQAPWHPNLHDNDLIIAVEIDPAGNILDTKERYEVKEALPISMRGHGDRFGRRERWDEEGGNRFTINQSIQTSLLPPSHPYYKIEVDR